MIWFGTEGNDMVWDGGLEPLVVPTMWDLDVVALGGAPVWPCCAVVGFAKRSVGRSIRVTYKEWCVSLFWGSTVIQ